MIFEVFLDFWRYSDVFTFFETFCIFFNVFFVLLHFCIFVLFSKLFRLLLKITKVTTGHQILPKICQHRIISFFLFARKAKKVSAEGQSPLEELEIGPHSGPYLLVFVIVCIKRKLFIKIFIDR